jgi:hypothetical protein
LDVVKRVEAGIGISEISFEWASVPQRFQMAWEIRRYGCILDVAHETARRSASLLEEDVPCGKAQGRDRLGCPRKKW